MQTHAPFKPSTGSRIRSGAALGASALALAGLLIADAAVVVQPRVVDSIGLALLLALLIPAGAGALAGGLIGAIAGTLRLPRFLPATLVRRLVRVSAALCLPLLLAPLWASDLPAPPDSNGSRPRILLIGIDGATWEQLDPLMAAGEMPHMNRLVAEGSRAILKSELPAFSPIIWTTIASGKSPIEHGISGAAQTANHVGVRRLWDILADSGYHTGTFNYLMTWPPPEKEHGYTVPGWAAHGPDSNPSAFGFLNRLRFSFTSSHDLSLGELMGIYLDWARCGGRVSTVARSLGRFIRAGAIPPSSEDFFYLSREALLDVKLDAFTELALTRPTDFTAIYIDTVDNQSHLYWRYLEPEAFDNVDETSVSRYGSVISDSYRHVDEAIGRVLHVAGHQDLVILISDHGFKAGNRHQTQLNVDTILETVGMSLDTITGYVIIHPNVYLTPAKDESGDSRELAAEISRRIEQILEPTTGAPLFNAKVVENGDVEVGVKRGGHRFAGAQGTRKEGTGRSRFTTATYEGREIDVSTLIDVRSRTFSGAHTLDGVLTAWGPGVRRNARIDVASIYDIVPTLLTVAGLPVGEDMPGKPLEALFTPDFLSKHPVTFTPTHERAGGPAGTTEDTKIPEALEKHLKALGYID